MLETCSTLLLALALAWLSKIIIVLVVVQVEDEYGWLLFATARLDSVKLEVVLGFDAYALARQ